MGDALGDLLPRRFFLSLEDPEAERDVLKDRHSAEQGVVLKHEPDLLLPDGKRRDILFGQQNLSLVGGFQPGDHPQQRRFSTARRPQERHQIAGLDPQVDGVDRLVSAEGLGQIPNFNTHSPLLGDSLAKAPPSFKADLPFLGGRTGFPATP